MVNKSVLCLHYRTLDNPLRMAVYRYHFFGHLSGKSLNKIDYLAIINVIYVDSFILCDAAILTGIVLWQYIHGLFDELDKNLIQSTTRSLRLYLFF